MKPNNLSFLLLAALVAAPTAARADAKLDAATTAVTEGADWLQDHPGAPTKESTKHYGPDAFHGTIAAGEACAKAVAAVSGSAKVTIDGVEITFADAKVKYCQAQIDYGKAADALVDEWLIELRAEKAAKYEALGVAGAKLELFIEYDSVYWRGKKCEIVDDLNVIVKAKKLYQWLENSDGTHTIRTYTFKGNTYKSKDKTYKTEAKAYKGCK